MGSIRFIIFAIVIWLVWRMVAKFIAEQKAKSTVDKQSQEKSLSGEKMVKCEYCLTHLPESSAISHSGKWFCDKQHRIQYLSENGS